MSLLVDTDWLIDGLRGQPTALSVFEARREEGLGVSMVTVGEVYESAYSSPQSDTHIATLHAFLALFTVLPINDETMRHFGRLRAMLRQGGNLIPDFDLLIAATAIENGLVLLTRNRRHFERIPGLELQ